jgi:hypothetical protein
LVLAELLEKAGEVDFLRAAAEAVLQSLMESDVEGLIGAGSYERSGERTTWCNGYRDRMLDTRLGTAQLRIDRDRGTPRGAPLPHHRAYGSVPRRFDWVKRGQRHGVGEDRVYRQRSSLKRLGPFCHCRQRYERNLRRIRGVPKFHAAVAADSPTGFWRMSGGPTEAKSAVARPDERKFLGFSISNDGSERRIAPKALNKFKTQVRDLTRRTRGISLPQLVENLTPYLIGWRGYFGFCQTSRVLTNLEACRQPQLPGQEPAHRGHHPLTGATPRKRHDWTRLRAAVAEPAGWLGARRNL